MKGLLTFFIFSFLSLSAFAAIYPTSCPSEAKAIVEVVGGCSAINRSSFPAIYDKCCAVTAPSSAPSVIPSNPPEYLAPSIIQPKTAPSTGSGQAPSIKIPSPVAAPRKKPAPLKFITPFSDLPYFPTSSNVSEPVISPKIENKLQSIFNGILRFFRFR